VGTTQLRLREVARRLGRSFEGDGDQLLTGVAALDAAGPNDLAFVRSLRHAGSARLTRAGALILPAGLDVASRPVIRSPNPGLDFARAVAFFAAPPAPVAGRHPSAVVAEDARVDATASLGAHAVLGARSAIGARSVLHPNTTVYPDVEIGEDCVLHAGVVVREGTRIGSRVVLHAGVVIGADGFGYAMDEHGRWEKVPQVGRVVIEDDVEIGANTTVDRATLGETRIGPRVKIDNLVQIAHNCEIGEDTMIAAQVGLAGSTVVERGVFFLGQAASAGHLRVGERAFVGARAGLHRDAPPRARLFGAPAMEERAWHRAMAALARLPEALRRLRAVERAVGIRAGEEAKAETTPVEDSRSG
jgi:UDP-3-O-[3-hydroxymyristoyl] glucosamine N-acyltransferase